MAEAAVEPVPAKKGGSNLIVIIVAALVAAGLAGGVVYFVTTLRSEGPAATEAAEAVVEASESAPAPVADVPAVVPPVQTPAVPDDPDEPRSLETITWTVAIPATLDELVQLWSLPRDTLAALNPALPTTEPLAAGTKVVVHTGSIATSESVGAANDGRLIGAVPFPEGRTWLLPPDRTRAFGTGETIIAVLAALDAYAAKYPDASPIQLDDPLPATLERVARALGKRVQDLVVATLNRPAEARTPRSMRSTSRVSSSRRKRASAPKPLPKSA